MLRPASDENFNGEVVRGLLRHQPDLDIVRTQDAGLLGADDPTVLAWAAAEGPILLTHVRATLPEFAYERVRAGVPMPGVFMASDRWPIGQAIKKFLLRRSQDPHSPQDDNGSCDTSVSLLSSPWNSARGFRRPGDPSSFVLCRSGFVHRST
jgi:hypothetical protein